MDEPNIVTIRKAYDDFAGGTSLTCLLCSTRT
jgi:hypothetical protein